MSKILSGFAPWAEDRVFEPRRASDPTGGPNGDVSRRRPASACEMIAQIRGFGSNGNPCRRTAQGAFVGARLFVRIIAWGLCPPRPVGAPPEVFCQDEGDEGVRDPEGWTRGPPDAKGRSMSARADILCIGSVLWDVIGRCDAPMRTGNDKPGMITRLPGGVGAQHRHDAQALRPDARASDGGGRRSRGAGPAGGMRADGPSDRACAGGGRSAHGPLHGDRGGGRADRGGGRRALARAGGRAHPRPFGRRPSRLRAGPLPRRDGHRRQPDRGAVARDRGEPRLRRRRSAAGAREPGQGGAPAPTAGPFRARRSTSISRRPG